MDISARPPARRSLDAVRQKPPEMESGGIRSAMGRRPGPHLEWTQMKTRAYFSMFAEQGSPRATGISRRRGVLAVRTTGVWRAAKVLLNGLVAKASNGASANLYPHGGCTKVFDSSEWHDQCISIADINDEICHGKVGHLAHIVRYSFPAMLRPHLSRWSC